MTPGWPGCVPVAHPDPVPSKSWRPLQDLKSQTASDGFITTLIKASENTDSEGEIREAIKLRSITNDFPGMSVFEGAAERTNFRQVHYSIRYCQRQCLRILRGLKAQQISCCALISCTLIKVRAEVTFQETTPFQDIGPQNPELLQELSALRYCYKG